MNPNICNDRVNKTGRSNGLVYRSVRLRIITNKPRSWRNAVPVIIELEGKQMIKTTTGYLLDTILTNGDDVKTHR